MSGFTTSCNPSSRFVTSGLWGHLYSCSHTHMETHISLLRLPALMCTDPYTCTYTCTHTHTHLLRSLALMYTHPPTCRHTHTHLLRSLALVCTTYMQIKLHIISNNKNKSYKKLLSLPSEYFHLQRTWVPSASFQCTLRMIIGYFSNIWDDPNKQQPLTSLQNSYETHKLLLISYQTCLLM